MYKFKYLGRIKFIKSGHLNIMEINNVALKGQRNGQSQEYGLRTKYNSGGD